MSAHPMPFAAAAPAKAPKPPLAPSDLLRWSLCLTAELVDLSPNKVRELIVRGEFPPRVAVDGKEQFVPAEVRAWAAGDDWRALVACRRQREPDRAT